MDIDLEINYAAPWLLDTAERVKIANDIWARNPSMDILKAEPWKLGDRCWFAPGGGYPPSPPKAD